MKGAMFGRISALINNRRFISVKMEEVSSKTLYGGLHLVLYGKKEYLTEINIHFSMAGAEVVMAPSGDGAVQDIATVMKCGRMVNAIIKFIDFTEKNPQKNFLSYTDIDWTADSIDLKSEIFQIRNIASYFSDKGIGGRIILVFINPPGYNKWNPRAVEASAFIDYTKGVAKLLANQGITLNSISTDGDMIKIIDTLDFMISDVSRHMIGQIIDARDDDLKGGRL